MTDYGSRCEEPSTTVGHLFNPLKITTDFFLFKSRNAKRIISHTNADIELIFVVTK